MKRCNILDSKIKIVWNFQFKVQFLKCFSSCLCMKNVVPKIKTTLFHRRKTKTHFPVSLCNSWDSLVTKQQPFVCWRGSRNKRIWKTKEKSYLGISPEKKNHSSYMDFVVFYDQKKIGLPYAVNMKWLLSHKRSNLLLWKFIPWKLYSTTARSFKLPAYPTTRDVSLKNTVYGQKSVFKFGKVCKTLSPCMKLCPTTNQLKNLLLILQSL